MTDFAQKVSSQGTFMACFPSLFLPLVADFMQQGSIAQRRTQSVFQTCNGSKDDTQPSSRGMWPLIPSVVGRWWKSACAEQKILFSAKSHVRFMTWHERAIIFFFCMNLDGRFVRRGSDDSAFVWTPSHTLALRKGQTRVIFHRDSLVKQHLIVSAASRTLRITEFCWPIFMHEKQRDCQEI